MAGSLVKIDEEIISGSVSSVAVGGANWDSSYDVYKVVSQITTDASFHEVPMRFFDSGGSVIDQTEYRHAFQELRSSTTFGEGKSNSTDRIYRPMRTGSGAAAVGSNVLFAASFTFFPHSIDLSFVVLILS